METAARKSATRLQRRARAQRVRARWTPCVASCAPALAGIALTLPLGAGCRCSAEAPGSSTRPVAAAEVAECARGSVQLTLAPAGAEAPPTEPPLDPHAELPFATEPGAALAARSGFFATGLKHEPRGAIALLGRVGAEDAPTELVELGRVRGDVLPPRLAGDAGDLWVVLQDGIGAGRELRIGHFESADLGAPARWRQGPSQPHAESSAFDITVSDAGALLVHEEWSVAGRHGRIAALALARGGAGDARLEGKPVTPVGMDAAAPRVARRRGGYWLAWLVNAAAAGAAPASEPGEAPGEPPPPDAYGARWLALARLDASGAISGELVRLTGKRERVVGFDLTASPSGAAWLAWRQDAPTPGASGGRVFVAEVREDGGRDSVVVRDADVGSGEPTWLYSGDDAARWLTFPDARDRTLLMRVSGWQRVGAPLRLGPDLESASALAASRGEILFAMPRGKALELFPARCVSAGEAADAGAGAAPPARDARAPR